MKKLFPLVVLCSAACMARADVVIVEKVSSAAQSTQITASVGPDKVRTDVNDQISTITDYATGDTTTLMHGQKSFLKMPASTMRAMMASAMAQAGNVSTTPPAPVATGKKDKINGVDADEYTFSNGNMKATYWIATNYPNGGAIKEALAKLSKGGMAQMVKGLTPDVSAFSGVPVKTETEMNGQKVTTELVSATEQTVDASKYAVPTDYTEMKMPTMPGAPSAPSAPDAPQAPQN